MSSSSPVPKPATAPKTEPRRSASGEQGDEHDARGAERRGTRSAPTPAAALRRRGRRGLEPVHQPLGPARCTSTITDCSDEKSTNGSHLDRLERVDVVVVDARDGADAQPAREHRRQRALAERAGGDRRCCRPRRSRTFGTRSKTSTSPRAVCRRLIIADGRRLVEIRSRSRRSVRRVSNVTRATLANARSIVPTRPPDASITGLPDVDAVVCPGGDRDALVERALRLREDGGVASGRSSASDGGPW